MSKKKHPDSKISISVEEIGLPISFPDSVCAVALIDDEHLVLVRQFREIHNQTTLELPGGKVEPRESIVNAVIRELHEETGVQCQTAKKLMMLDMDFSVSLHKTHLMLIEMDSGMREANSKLNLLAVPLNEARRMIEDGQITHAPTVAAVLWLVASRS